MNIQALNVTNVTIQVAKKDFLEGTWYNIWIKKLYRCIKCGKKYKHYNSLNRHSKKCLK